MQHNNISKCRRLILHLSCFILLCTKLKSATLTHTTLAWMATRLDWQDMPLLGYYKQEQIIGVWWTLSWMDAIKPQNQKWSINSSALVRSEGWVSMVSEVSTHSPNVFMYVLYVAPSVRHHARCFPGPKALRVWFIHFRKILWTRCNNIWGKALTKTTIHY